MDKDHYPKPNQRFYFIHRSLENKVNLTKSKDHWNNFLQAQVSKDLMVKTEGRMEHKHTDITVT